MTGSSELEGLWPLPTLRGQSYTTHFLLSTGSGFILGTYMRQGGRHGGSVVSVSQQEGAALVLYVKSFLPQPKTMRTPT